MNQLAKETASLAGDQLASTGKALSAMIYGDLFKVACVVSIALIAFAMSLMFKSYFAAVSKQPAIVDKVNAVVAAAFIELAVLLVFVIFVMARG